MISIKNKLLAPTIWMFSVLMLIYVDQYTKTYFSSILYFGQALVINDWFNLVHYRNTGAAFSFLANAGGWQKWFFITVSILVIGVVGLYCLAGKSTKTERVLGAMLIGGAGGNLIDRWQAGAVTDFLDFHWNGYHWPAFNLADVFIVTSTVLWLITSWREERKRLHLNKIKVYNL